MKKQLARALSVLLLVLFACFVPGRSVRAEGRVPGQEDLNYRVRLNAKEEFDTASGLFVFDVAGASVTMNLPDGIVTNGAVSLGVPAGLAVKVYRDGVLQNQPDLKNIAEPGGYIVLLGNNDNVSISFTIVSAYSSNLVRYNLPDGFSVQQVLLDGQPIRGSESTVDMKQEGSYVIDYGCEYIGKSYRLEVMLDHTAPTLEIKGVENGYADGPVEITETEPGCTVTVFRDGKEMPFRSPITGSGKYAVTVKDAAGNTTAYSFTIGLYFTMNRLTVVIILAAAAAAVLTYMWVSRKRLKIR